MRMHNEQIACMWREKRYRDGRRPLGAWEKAIGGTLCESLEAIDPIPGRLGSSDACIVAIMSIAPVHRHANSTRPHRGIVHSTSTHSTSTQHTIALRKSHTAHSHTRADRASCPQQKSAGARSAHTQNTSMHKANRGGSRHNTGTKGAGTCMIARAGTGDGVYTRSASAMVSHDVVERSRFPQGNRSNSWPSGLERCLR